MPNHLRVLKEEAKEPATATDEEEIDLWKPLYEIQEREEEKQPGPAAEAEEVTIPEPVCRSGNGGNSCGRTAFVRRYFK